MSVIQTSDIVTVYKNDFVAHKSFLQEYVFQKDSYLLHQILSIMRPLS